MSKTMRKVVAFATMAAMAIAMVPSASAAAEYLLIDKVAKNSDETTRVRFTNNRDTTKNVNQELKDAIADMSIDYNQATNTVTIKRMPSTVPYIRPYEYCEEYQTDNFNYAPYLPLTVYLGFYSNTGYFEDISKATKIEVDGERYELEKDGDKVVTPNQIAFLMRKNTNLQDGGRYVVDVTTADNIITTAFGGAAHIKNLGGYPYLNEFIRETDEATAKTALEDTAGFGLVEGLSPAAVYNMVVAKLNADPRMLDIRNLLLGTENQAAIDAFIEGMADAAKKAVGTSVSNYVNIYNAMGAYWVNTYKTVATGSDTGAGTLEDPNFRTTFLGVAQTGTTGSYFPIHVYHDLRENKSTHTVEIWMGSESYKRTFTVVNNITSAYTVQSATKAAGLNYENMLVTADSGNLFIQYAMKDLVGSDTWGSVSSAYKLWDRSNFTLAGTWLSFKDTVKQGDTVFFDTNVTLANENGEKIPAGTKLTLQFNKQVQEQRYFNFYNVKDYTYQYSNKTTVTVKDDNSFDFTLGLDKYDMEWLYNGHQQNYVQVTIDNDTYYGTFYVRFSARDRIATTVSFAEGTRIQLKVGESKDINAVLLENAMSTTIGSWTSSNSAIATVSGSGLKASVTGVSVGSAVITAKTAAGETGTIIVDVVGDTTTEVPSNVKTFKVVTTSTRLNVRSGAGTSYSIIGKLDKGATFQGEANEAGDWIKLNYNGQTGYVSSKYVVAQ